MQSRKGRIASALGPVTTEPAKAGRALSVGELSRRITHALEGQVGFVHVEGEISNYRLPASGHAYFVLKDAEAAINAVCFRSRLQAIRATLADGKKVELAGRITAYTARSEYQIIVESVREAGLGDLLKRFIELRDRLKAEGLFDAARKRALPAHPRVVGLVTSATGAALRDMLHVLARRAGGLEVLVSACAVQGAAAAGEIAAAIRRLERDARADVIIVGRGGGSIEDLWAFNEEMVVRAIAACRIPVISAVGHETDTTLADYAADLRAPTPSAAAEIVTANYEKLIEGVLALDRRLELATLGGLDTRRSALDRLTGSWGMRRPLDQLHAAMQRVDDLAARIERQPGRRVARDRERLGQVVARLQRASPQNRVARRAVDLAHLTTRLERARPDLRWAPILQQRRAVLAAFEQSMLQSMRSRIREKRLAVQALSDRLKSLGPESVLKRGFSIVTLGRAGRIVTTPDQVKPGQSVRVQSAGGVWRAAVLPQGEDMFEG